MEGDPADTPRTGLNSADRVLDTGRDRAGEDATGDVGHDPVPTLPVAPDAAASAAAMAA